MEILLIQPRNLLFKNDKSNILLFPPLGLAYLAAYLRNEPNINIKIIDCLIESKCSIETIKDHFIVGLPDHLLLKKINDLNPDIIGISAVGSQSHEIYINLVNYLKKHFPKKFVFLGGAHASSCYEQILKNCKADGVIIGEGELTFLEVCTKIMKNENLLQTDGLVYKEGNKIFINPPRQLLKNIDKLPFPSYDLFKIEKYFKNQMNWDGFYNKPAMPILSSRGCPYNCVHCAFKNVWGERKWRPRSAQNVIEEIELLVNEFGAKEIHFMDDNLSFNASRLENICNLIADRNIKISWQAPNGLAYWTLNSNLIKRMKVSGCKQVAFGFESGSKKVLQFISKPHNNIKAKRIVKTAKRVGLFTIGYFIIGFPNENSEDIKNTVNFAKYIGVDYVAFNPLTIFPGTRLWEIFQNDSYLKSTNENLLWNKGINTRFFNRNQILKKIFKSYRQFYFYKLISFQCIVDNIFRVIRVKNSLDLKAIFINTNKLVKIIYIWFLK